MTEDDIKQIFFVECEEALEAAEAGLAACRDGTHDAETINAIFRAVHSIKGGAGAFGHTALAAYTHGFENLLGEIREGLVPLDPALVDLLLLALDCLRDHVEAARGGGCPPDDAELLARLEAARAGNGGAVAASPPAPAPAPAPAPVPAPEPAFDDLDALLDELSAPAPATAPPAPETWLVHIRPHAGAMTKGSEPLLWLRELTDLGGTCELCDITAVPTFERLLVEEGYLGWTFRMPGHVSREAVAEIFDFVGDEVSVAYGPDGTMPSPRISGSAAPLSGSTAAPSLPAAAPAQPAAAPPAATTAATPAAAAPANQSVRIDLRKLDMLIDGVGELVIAQAMLAQRLANENLAHVEELALIETLVRDVQEHAMAFRAQPISSVFGRVPRLLRELGTSTGKHVKLEVAGETTELDKTVIERLSEPMTHLIRNAVDHGIEPPEERRAAGKDPEGTLTLSAEQKAGRIIIRIADDGRGIDRERVLAKAIANGLVAPDAQLSDDEINLLIFAPGFSTAAQVSNISGRGVGMDVVKQNVKELGGRITIESTPGKGTTFSLALPLTLAISDGMIVQVGDHSLVIPLTHVIESLRPTPADVKGMGTRAQMLNARGSFVPIVPLGPLTGAQNAVSNPCEGVLVLVETEGHGRAALLVDAITDQRQFVIKALDAHYRQIESVAGATILGNGKVALIVDVDFIASTAARSMGAVALAAAA
ncbi:chemotaxis protein CheA [Erythrobacter sp. BLCC-B19]|uniref:chemotaxis protein CheA n=1 Tax=Erythrobacter sp. BLCC-B19 TaxID=3025315 RepID=UPI00236015ED|nr:chemotaxis protein CheA [Erythrobacter sp. BLCC-B19]WDA40182.1 chemotaxis protein CheA [Erythrobacter sp. BLCC-B19]